MMIATLLLVPAACHANDPEQTELRIKQIEDARFKKETEIAELNSKILRESRPYHECKELALRFWVPSEGQNKEDSFLKFIDELCEAFDSADDIYEDILKKAPLLKYVHIKFIVSRVVLQELFIQRLANHYMLLMSELFEINKELITLESKGKL